MRDFNTPAIKRSIQGISLYWVESLGDVGLNLSALADLLGMDTGNLSKLVRKAGLVRLPVDYYYSQMGDCVLIRIYTSDDLIKIIGLVLDSRVKGRSVRRKCKTTLYTLQGIQSSISLGWKTKVIHDF